MNRSRETVHFTHRPRVLSRRCNSFLPVICSLASSKCACSSQGSQSHTDPTLMSHQPETDACPFNASRIWNLKVELKREERTKEEKSISWVNASQQKMADEIHFSALRWFPTSTSQDLWAWDVDVWWQHLTLCSPPWRVVQQGRQRTVRQGLRKLGRNGWNWMKLGGK